MKELLKLAPSSEIQSPSAVLQLADTLVSVGKLDEAARLLDSHSDFVDLSILNADHYALLASFCGRFNFLSFLCYVGIQ